MRKFLEKKINRKFELFMYETDFHDVIKFINFEYVRYDKWCNILKIFFIWFSVCDLYVILVQLFSVCLSGRKIVMIFLFFHSFAFLCILPIKFLLNALKRAIIIYTF